MTSLILSKSHGSSSFGQIPPATIQWRGFWEIQCQIQPWWHSKTTSDVILWPTLIIKFSRHHSMNLITIIFFFLLGLHQWHIEVARLGVELDLQLPVYATATATARDPSLICDLHQSSQQRLILNRLKQGRDRTCILMHTNLILNLLSHDGNSKLIFITAKC